MTCFLVLKSNVLQHLIIKAKFVFYKICFTIMYNKLYVYLTNIEEIYARNAVRSHLTVVLQSHSIFDGYILALFAFKQHVLEASGS